MWKIDSNYGKWVSTDDKLTREDFDFYKQELQSVRFWSKCLSGATYVYSNGTQDLYEVLTRHTPKNWYIPTTSSPYSSTIIPAQNAAIISITSSYHEKYLHEYNLTLKNLFTPNNLIKDISNYVYVDLATTETIDLTQYTLASPGTDLYIDDVKLKDGHKVLIKHQFTSISLLNTDNVTDYITGNYTLSNSFGALNEYQYYNEANGIYTYQDGKLLKDNILDDYRNCINFSVNVKLGRINAGKQFHLSRLLDGTFPTSANQDPMEFKEKTNLIVRNRVDYNNLFETNYFDIIKNGTQSYFFEGVTYSIPPRTLAVGEFGVIVNTQNGRSNIIRNKYKVNLRGISETVKYYWICGDDNTLLRVRKHDFEIVRIELENVPSVQAQVVKTNLNSVSFFNDLRGAVVGELNTIYVTKNGGTTWTRIESDDFDAYNYNKVLFSTATSFFIAGRNGIFIEMVDTVEGWIAYKRRISKKIDDDDEYVLVDDINDLFKTSISSWSATYSYSTSSIPTNKELLFLAVDNSNLIAYDISNSFTQVGTDFLYFDFSDHYGDIRNIMRRKNTDNFYFTGTDPNSNLDGLFSFDINNFPTIGTGSSYSNTAVSISPPTFEAEVYPNEIFDYEGDELLICGNYALLGTSTYSTIEFSELDPNFTEKLKSRMLVLDYSIGSKLNFFTDEGDYRMPNSVTFSVVSLTASSMALNTLIIAATAPSYLTQSETNWITYWTDREKTFEFYTNTPMDESVKVLISPTFSYSAITSSYSISTITGSASQISYLAPMITYATQSRFDSQGLPSISAPTVAYDIYLYDYLMVAKVSSSFPVDVGDVMRFKSAVVDKDLLVNKVVIFGSDKYLYMFTEFNQNIITELTLTTGYVSMTNLNKFTTLDDLMYRFNEHPLGQAYKLEFSDEFGNVSQPEDPTTGILKVSTLFNYLTSYYNLGTNVVVDGVDHEMKYTSGFLNFGYSPQYNIFSYMEGLNAKSDFNPKFFANKEYLAMPEYRNIPLGTLDGDNAYIETNGMTYSGGNIVLPGNKILFSPALFFEWQSIFRHTFVDIVITTTSTTYTTEKLLVIDKYYNAVDDYYIIEFHKRLDFTLFDPDILNGGYLDILSRRTLKKISDDLQELNNIQRSKSKKNLWKDQGPFEFYSYENELNFKIPTDSYAKILLSDADTVDSLSGIIYIDHKQELAMNITQLEKEFEIPINNTSVTVATPFFDANKLYVSCLQKHGLITGDGVVLEFNGGTGSSQELNQQYFGYQTVIKVTDYDFVVDIEYGQYILIGNDTGVIKYSRQDPFLNFIPIDLIDLAVNQRGKQSIELLPENLIVENNIYKLVNVDDRRFRFRLVDGLNLETLSLNFSWILEAEISGAVIGISNGLIVWYKGTWECGRWFGGTWYSGVWMSGDWYGGVWNSNIVNDKILSVEVDTKTVDYERSIWYSGRWYTGLWTNGTWNDGRWYDGTWISGVWYNGIWNDGTWTTGDFQGGIWVYGTWENGVFNCNNGPAYWLDGFWNSGDFENGMWYNGVWESKNGESRFGTNAYNSRTATWQAGRWLSGSFYSRLNRDDYGNLIVSDSHKLAIWKTGIWVSGEWYGGIAYNMDWKIGTWFGGILDEIEIVSIDTSLNTFTVNGIFKFNIGDEIFIIDNQIGNLYSPFGSNQSPGRYKVLYREEDSVNKLTKLYVNNNLASIGPSITGPTDTGLRIVSKFKTVNWKTGIWTNGLFEEGLWEGGIWYQGVFDAIWM